VVPTYAFVTFDAADGPFGSLCWGPRTNPMVKSAHRRFRLEDIRAVRRGADSSFFQRLSTALPNEVLDADQCVTIYSADDLVRWSSPSRSLSSFLTALQIWLSWSGRSLVVEENTNGQWFSVTGVEETEEEMRLPAEEVVAAAPAAAPLVRAESMDAAQVAAKAVVSSVEQDDFVVVQSVSSDDATGAPDGTANLLRAPTTLVPPPSQLAPGQTFVPPAVTPEYLAAVELLSRGREFYAYFWSSESVHSEEPLVKRKKVCIFFSSAVPPQPFDTSLYQVPIGETAFPAFYAVEYQGDVPPRKLAPHEMTPQTVLSLHELSDLYIGDSNPVFHSPSALSQFVPAGQAAFEEDRCISIVSSGCAKRGMQTEEWNLEARKQEGFEEWLNAINLVLPLHLDEAEQAAAAATAATAAAVQQNAAPATAAPASQSSSSSASAAPQSSPSPQMITLNSVLPMMDAAAPSASAGTEETEEPSPLVAASSHVNVVDNTMSRLAAATPIEACKLGAPFLLFLPDSVGGSHITSKQEVKLFYRSAADLKAMGARPQTAYPMSEQPESEEDDMGALFYVPLPFTGDITATDLSPSRCAPLHALSDVFHGSETPLWQDEAVASQGYSEEDCLVLTSTTIPLEWDLVSLHRATDDFNLVTTFLAGIQEILDGNVSTDE
jgi:hypothetical protein